MKLHQLTDPNTPLSPFCGTCGICGEPEPYTYHVPESLWRKVLPESLWHSVVCMRCFHERAKQWQSTLEQSEIESVK